MVSPVAAGDLLFTTFTLPLRGCADHGAPAFTLVYGYAREEHPTHEALLKGSTIRFQRVGRSRPLVGSWWHGSGPAAREEQRQRERTAKQASGS